LKGGCETTYHCPANHRHAQAGVDWVTMIRSIAAHCTVIKGNALKL